MVHFATIKLDDLACKLSSHFRDHFVAGEEVTGERAGGVLASCRVLEELELDVPPEEGAWGGILQYRCTRQRHMS